MALLEALPEALADQFTDYLPQATPHPSSGNNNNSDPKPFVTLTYASSLDSQISLAPGVQTLLSGPLTKHFTHHLRSRHAAILVGATTAIADDPGLNCRIRHVDQDAQPRPIVLDPRARWLCSWIRRSSPPSNKNALDQQQNIDESKFTEDDGMSEDMHEEYHSDIGNCRLLRTAREGKGSSPWVLVRQHKSSMTNKDAHEHQRLVAEKAFIDSGGHIIYIPEPSVNNTTTAITKPNTSDNNHLGNQKWSWSMILSTLAHQGITSLMVEGGASVINGLLSIENLHLIDSVIITIAPVFLGQGGVAVLPPDRSGQGQGGTRDGERVTAVKFSDVRWCVMENDVVMMGRPVI